jgi:hypothetical protein
MAAEVRRDSDPPAVLRGHADDAEPVWRELEDDPAMQRFVARARRAARFCETLPTEVLAK